MEHFNILLNFFTIFAMVFIATPNEAGGFKILNYDEDFPAHQWPRVIYRERLPIIHKKDTFQKTDENQQELDDYLKPNPPPVNEGNPTNQTKRISDFYENIAQQKKYVKDSGSKVIYDRVPIAIILVYPKPYQ